MTTGDERKLAPASGAVGASAVTTDRSASAVDGAERLLRLAGIGEELGTSRVADEARELASRISEGRFYVACVGQFKRGKSTLINALIGAPVLPVGFIPVTAVPTVIRFGEALKARIRGRDRSWQDIPVSEVKQFVSEEHNPENTKGVTGVEVFVPSPLLSTGICLVDTPGLGSVFSGNTAATQDFIPHVDAALVVVGADPPLAGEELALVEAVAQNVRDVIVVLNKADRTTEAEKAAAAQFTRALLEKRLITTAGRKEVIGRPILYRTSKQFMIRFGLSDLDALPSLKEFEQLAQAALGSDAGIAPTEPEPEAQGGLESASPAESGEAARIRESGKTNDLAELGEDGPESSEQSRAASAGTNEQP